MNVVFQAVLVFTLLISATTGAEGGVSIWMDSVTLYCPKVGDWSKAKGSSWERIRNGSATYEYTYEGLKDQFSCEYEEASGKKTYQFYIQGKACKNCIELDALVVAVVIVVDVIGTTVVMAIVYKCCKKSSGGQQKAAKARSRERDIPLTPQTYEPLNPRTRSEDPYSAIHSNINRMG